jgi:hypothetical protein
MATRKIYLQEYPEVIGENPELWNGPSPGGAAAELKVTRQMIHKYIKKGLLDRVFLMSEDGKRIATIITQESINRLKEERHAHS